MAKVAELHKVQLGYLRKLEGINSELELLASDIKAQKELQTRQIKLGVAALQQAVLERGKLLAKQTSALYDEQVTQVLAFRSGVSQAIQAVLSRITSLKDMKQLEGEELDQQLQDYVLNTPCQAPCAVKLPAPIALTRLDQDPILRAINEIELVPVDAKDDQKKDQQLFSFPEVQIKEGTELDVVCTDLWWASRPCFSLLPAISALPAALDSLSISTRRMYIEDQDWCCFDGGIREENGHGEKTGVNAPKVGSNVLVRLPSNKQWCRANVISNNASKSTCEVYLLDWGQTVPDVPWLDLLPTRQPFTQTPPAALECVFDEAIEAKDTLDARWTFNDLVQKFSSACKPLRVKFISQVEVSGRLVWLVELRGTKPDGTDVDIHKVISEKLAAAAEKNALSIQCRDIREEFAHTRVTFNAGRRGVQPDDTSPASEAVSPQSASNMPHTTAPITEHSAENVLSDNRGMQMTEKQEVGKQELPAGARHVTADRSSIFINKKESEDQEDITTDTAENDETNDHHTKHTCQQETSEITNKSEENQCAAVDEQSVQSVVDSQPSEQDTTRDQPNDSGTNLDELLDQYISADAPTGEEVFVHKQSTAGVGISVSGAPANREALIDPQRIGDSEIPVNVSSDGEAILYQKSIGDSGIYVDALTDVEATTNQTTVVDAEMDSASIIRSKSSDYKDNQDMTEHASGNEVNQEDSHVATNVNANGANSNEDPDDRCLTGNGFIDDSNDVTNRKICNEEIEEQNDQGIHENSSEQIDENQAPTREGRFDDNKGIARSDDGNGTEQRYDNMHIRRRPRGCFECGSEDHLWRDCKFRKDQGCYSCGSLDHIKRECPSRTNKGHDTEQRYHYKPTNIGPRRCLECGSEDHIRRDCKLSLKYQECYSCGSFSHMQRECPSRQEKPARECSSGQEKPVRECSSGQEKPERECSSGQEKPARECSSGQEKPARVCSSGQEKPERECSSRQEKPASKRRKGKKGRGGRGWGRGAEGGSRPKADESGSWRRGSARRSEQMVDENMGWGRGAERGSEVDENKGWGDGRSEPKPDGNKNWRRGAERSEPKADPSESWGSGAEGISDPKADRSTS